MDDNLLMDDNQPPDPYQEWREQILSGTADEPTVAAHPPPDALTAYPHPAAYSDPTAWDYPPTGGFWAPGRKVTDAGKALTALAVCVGVVATVVLLAETRPRPQEKVTPGPTVTITTQTTVTATATATQTSRVTPPPDAQAENPDEHYLQLITQLSGFGVSDPVPVITLGHRQCAFLSANHTPQEAAADLMRRYFAPGGGDLTREQAFGIVEAAVLAYCPQFSSGF